MEARINLHTGEQNFEQRYFPDEPGAGHFTFLFVFKPKTLGGRLREGWSFLELTYAPVMHYTYDVCYEREISSVFILIKSFTLSQKKPNLRHLYILDPVYLQNSTTITCRVSLFCEMYRRILVYKCLTCIKLFTLRSS